MNGDTRIARLVLIILLAIFAITSFVVLKARFETGLNMPEYSIYSNADNGLYRAAYVLKQLGFSPVGLSRPIQNTKRSGLLIVVEPQSSNLFIGQYPGLGSNDAKGMLDWVAEGNTLVMVARNGNSLHDQLNVMISGDFDGAEAEELYFAQTSEIGGYTEPISENTLQVLNIGVEGKDTVRGDKGIPLWSVGKTPGAWLVPHGKGRVLFIADPSVWTHRGLLRNDNVLLLNNIARMDSVNGRVLFDEYHHGIRSGGGFLGYLRYHNLHWIFAQILILVGVAIWAQAIRLGPAIPIPVSRKEDAVDYASAVARIYQRAGLLHIMADHIVRDFLEGLTRHLRLARQSGRGEILNTWKKRHDVESTKELMFLLDTADELRNPPGGIKPNKRALLEWAKTFDEFLQRARQL